MTKQTKAQLEIALTEAKNYIAKLEVEVRVARQQIVESGYNTNDDTRALADINTPVYSKRVPDKVYHRQIGGKTNYKVYHVFPNGSAKRIDSHVSCEFCRRYEYDTNDVSLVK